MTDYNIDFKDHVVQFPNRFKQVQVSPGVVDLIPTWIENPTEVIEAGTPVNSDLFDKLRANVTRRSETFSATAGQTVFNLTKAYLVDQGRIDVYISGIKQRSGVDFTETSPTSFTLSEGLDAGTIVEAVYFSASQALSEDLIEQVQAAEAAIIAANEATANAIDATEGALTANLKWKEPVNNLAALNALSNPQIRDTRQTRDTGDVYRYDGSAWVLIQTMDPNAITALETRLTSQLADIAINVKLFGAKGDGVTDDYSRLQNAANQLPDGRTLRVPKGDYILSNVILFEGKNDITIILEKGANLKVQKHGYGAIEIKACTNVVVQGGLISGPGNFYAQTLNPDGSILQNEKTIDPYALFSKKNGDANIHGDYNGGKLTNSGNGILVYDGSFDVTIDSVEIKGFNNSGISAGWLPDTNWSEGVIVKDCHIHDNQNAGVLATKVKNFRMYDNDVHDIGHPSSSATSKEINMGYGFATPDTTLAPVEVEIYGNLFRRCKRKAIDFHSCNIAKIKDNTIRDCLVYGIAMTQNSQNAQFNDYEILGNKIFDCGVAPILSSIETPCGIFAAGLCDKEVRGNKVVNSGKTGISMVFPNYPSTKLFDGAICDNTVKGSHASDSILVSMNYNDVRVKISGNPVKNSHSTARGIYVTSNFPSGGNCRSNIISNDVSAATALSLYQVLSAPINNNTLIGSVRSIDMFDCGDGVVVDNTNVLIGPRNNRSLPRDNYTSAFRLRKQAGAINLTPLDAGTNASPISSVTSTSNAITVVFKSKFTVLPSVIFTPLSASVVSAFPSSWSGSSITFQLRDTAGNTVNLTNLADGFDSFVTFILTTIS